MPKPAYIKRYSAIIRKLQRSPVNFQQLCFYLENESAISGYYLDISQRTFQRDIKDISSLFGIEIRCNKAQNIYYIDEEECADLHGMRLLEAYEMLDALRTTGNYTPYVFFESRRPNGTEHFYNLLRAAKEHKVTEFTYKKFYEDEPESRTVYPLALKESRGRWYLVAMDRKDDKIKTFGLDRITEPVISSRKFKVEKIPGVREIFKNCFGIINPAGSAPQKVVLSFTYQQGQYIKSYPLHESQQLVSEDEDENKVVVSLNIYITYDFIMELLSYGEEVMVVSPKSLITKIIKTNKNTLKMYE